MISRSVGAGRARVAVEGDGLPGLEPIAVGRPEERSHSDLRSSLRPVDSIAGGPAAVSLVGR